MWRWRAEVAAIGMDRHQLACWDGGQLREVAHGGGAEPPTTGSLRQALTALLDGRKPRRMELSAGADLCRHWVFEVPASVRSFEELRLLARLRAAQLFGSEREAGGDWAVTGDWRPEGRVFAGALPVAWLDGIQQASREFGMELQLRSAQELALGVQWPKDGRQMLAWQTPRHLALALVDEGSVQAWRGMRLPSDLPAPALAALVAAETAGMAAALGVAAPPVQSWEAPWPRASEPGWSEAAWAARVAAFGLTGVAS